MEEERNYSFYGFHGTAESCAIEIAASQEFSFGTPREDHWLGQGAYFYKDDELQAAFWARSKVRNHVDFRGQRPYVIEVGIKVNESNFLNLDSRIGLDQLDSFLDVLENEGLSITWDDKTNTPEKIRCYILSLLPDSIWVIQRTFDINSRYDGHLKFKEMDMHLHETQICLKNNEAIDPGSLKVNDVKFEGFKKQNRRKPRLMGGES